MFDISQFTTFPWIDYAFIGLLGVVTIVVILSYTFNGIIKDIFKLGYYVGLYFMIKYLYTFVENYVKMVPIFVVFPIVVTIVTILLILIVWVAATKLLNLIFSRLFKAEKKITRLFGFLLSLPIALIFNLLIVGVASPFVLNGGQNLTSGQYSSLYVNSVIRPIQDKLFEANVPSSLETYMITITYQDSNDKKVAYESFKIFLNYQTQGQAYLDSLDAETSVKLADSLLYVSKCVNTFNNDAMKVYMLNQINSYIASYEGSTVTISVSKESLFAEFTTLGITAANLQTADSIFVE